MTHAASPDHPGALNWTLLVLLGAIWGAAFMGQSLALEGFGPLTVAALRCLLAAVALLALAVALGQGPVALWRKAGPLGLTFLALVGLVGTAVPFALLAWGLQHVPSAVAGVTMGAVPLLLLPLVAIFSPEEGIGPRRLMGVGLGFCGLLVLIGPDALQALSAPETAAANDGAPNDATLTLAGRLACLGAATCYAVGSVITRRAPRMPPIGFAAVSLALAALALLPVALAREGWPAGWAPGPTWAILLTALFPTGLAAALRVRIITTAGSLFMSLVSYMVPVWSIIFGWALLGEALRPSLFAGLALILGGIAVAQSRALLARLTWS